MVVHTVLSGPGHLVPRSPQGGQEYWQRACPALSLSPPSPQLRAKQDPFPFLSPRFQGNLTSWKGLRGVGTTDDRRAAICWHSRWDPGGATLGALGSVFASVSSFLCPPFLHALSLAMASAVCYRSNLNLHPGRLSICTQI